MDVLGVSEGSVSGGSGTRVSNLYLIFPGRLTHALYDRTVKIWDTEAGIYIQNARGV